MSRSTLNLIGVIILIIGLSCVALIERNAQIADATAIEDSEATHMLLHPEDYGSYSRASEEMGGKFGSLLVGWVKWAISLGHSRSFAVVVAAVSLIAGGGILVSTNLSPRK